MSRRRRRTIRTKRRAAVTTRADETRRRLSLPRPDKRQWESAKISVLQSNWQTWAIPIDVDLRRALPTLRARSRYEAQNNDHAKHFLRLVKTNVIGRKGIQMQGRLKLKNGKPDQRANDALEEAWKAWGRRGNCDVTGQWGWIDFKRLAIETVAREGEAIVRTIPGWENNRFRFALQMIDPESLDVQLNKDLGNGRRIVMGVELDEWRRPVAYYLLPDQMNTYGSARPRKHSVVPAEEIIHCYLPEWVWQTRGVPWMSTSLRRAHNLSGYEDAEVVASRAGAAKMGHYEQQPEAGPFVPDGEDSQGEFLENFEPGRMDILPPGWTFKLSDPQHPNSIFGDFVKASLRGIASGWGVNYNTLANDLEGVNYSSLRHGSLTERDVWMSLQDWFVECFCWPVFYAWLKPALLFGQVRPANGLPFSAERELDFQRVSWQPRRWPWVDPLKETQANAEAFGLRTKSISSIIRDQGEDPDEVWAEMQRDNERLKEFGIQPPATAKPAQPQAPTAAPDEEGINDAEQE